MLGVIAYQLKDISNTLVALWLEIYQASHGVVG
jgi:hypothetical protein